VNLHHRDRDGFIHSGQQESIFEIRRPHSVDITPEATNESNHCQRTQNLFRIPVPLSVTSWHCKISWSSPSRQICVSLISGICSKTNVRLDISD
jgi:hypothetical protein